jgi:uncharacterized damage-inducible protein DinB
MPAHVPPVADERSGLLAFLEQQRQLVRTATYGLTDEEAAATPSASSLSVGGIVKHLARTERNWMDTVRGEHSRDVTAYVEGFRFGGGDRLADVLADYEAAARETEKVIADIDDLGQPVPVPRGVPWFPQDVDAWSVRWVLLHLIEETARHAGHADIVRESLDGATSISLLAAQEQWPANDFVQPWTRTATQTRGDTEEGQR